MYVNRCCYPIWHGLSQVSAIFSRCYILNYLSLSQSKFMHVGVAAQPSLAHPQLWPLCELVSFVTQPNSLHPVLAVVHASVCLDWPSLVQAQTTWILIGFPAQPSLSWPSHSSTSHTHQQKLKPSRGVLQILLTDLLTASDLACAGGPV